MKLHEMTWPEAAKIDRSKTLVLAPIAACEQHARHLPTFTDTILNTSIAEEVERSLSDRILLLPTLWIGASDHHLPYGATLTVTVDTHVTLVRELLAPLLGDGFQRFFVLNGHGGNIDTLHLALRQLQPLYADRLLAGAGWWEPAERELADLAQGERKDVGHACEFETALMLHFRPDLVRHDEILDDPPTHTEALRGVYLAGDMGLRTDHGAVGFPESATAESGKRMAEVVVGRLVEVCQELFSQPIVRGRQMKH